MKQSLTCLFVFCFSLRHESNFFSRREREIRHKVRAYIVSLIESKTNMDYSVVVPIRARIVEEGQNNSLAIHIRTLWEPTTEIDPAKLARLGESVAGLAEAQPFDGRLGTMVYSYHD